jgi:hypothetical protein
MSDVKRMRGDLELLCAGDVDHLIATARSEALEEAIYTLQKMPYEYLDGPSIHVETMTIGRAVIAITKLKEEKKND